MVAPTTPPPTLEMLFEETEPTFLEVLNKVSRLFLQFSCAKLIVAVVKLILSSTETILFDRNFPSETFF